MSGANGANLCMPIEANELLQLSHTMRKEIEGLA